ncbi:hypothetical protein G6F56_006958 [Rhizopus delemar]|nr:hypothetical protein G6F56_006958 [Rhizopus delemar]
MDLIIVGNILNDTGKKENIELGTIEIKKEDVTDEVCNTQLNKNIRINKSILKRLNNHIANGDDMSTLEVLGLDVKGVNAFTYIIRPYENIGTAVKTCDEPMFLHMDDDDFSEFIYCSSLDQLLNYQKHIITLNCQLDQASG